jgi:hypothetical protein
MLTQGVALGFHIAPFQGERGMRIRRMIAIDALKGHDATA